MSNPDPPSTPKSRSKLLMIGVPVAVLLLGGAGGGFWYVKNVRAASTGEKKAVEEPEATGYLRFDPFTVNLADPGGRRYLRVAVGLVLQDVNTAKKVDRRRTGHVEGALHSHRHALRPHGRRPLYARWPRRR